MDDGIVFDTHRFIKRLVKTGMDERTAEVLAEEQVSLLNSNLATKFSWLKLTCAFQGKLPRLIYVLPKLKRAYPPVFLR